MDVGTWLRSLGLEQYEAAFRANDVDAEVLPTLTAEELKDIGVSSIRHRRRLLEAITALRLQATPAAEGPAQVSSSPAPSDPNGSVDMSETTAERRPLSVMFCDMVGSTALSSRLDPEDLREVIRAYQACVATTIRQFDGFIARYVGDGVLIYFGWPEARETDAERAVRAALAVAAAIDKGSIGGELLHVRIGIATGLVVVGDPIGSGDSRQQTAIGETPNRASRLQGLSGPNEVVIDSATRRQIGEFFECQDLGPVQLKGLPGEVSAWRVEGESALVSRFEALHGGAMSPLVGRGEELEFLLRRWRGAKAGEGQVVLLSGEPGIGKSRLLAELEQRLATELHLTLRYFCSPHYQESALHPIIACLQQEAGFVRAESDAERLRKLEEAHGASAIEDVPLIADLLSVSTGAGYPELDYGPRQKKQKVFEALCQRLDRQARQGPVLMLFEDAHWADPSSLELLDVIVRMLASLPVLLVISFRIEFAPPWIGLAGVNLLAPNRLNDRQSTELAAGVTTRHTLAPALLKRIVVQADGVPLFIEELTKAVLESAGYRAGADIADLVIPATLQASLMARLDRIPIAKQVAQVGAVAGREFSHALVSVIARLPATRLQQGLDELVGSGLAVRHGASPDAVYSFKHALVQEVAYESLLRSRRATIHAAIVYAVERDPNIASMPSALLGYHCARAGLVERAANYYRLAGDRSAGRSAVAEARAQLERGLGLIRAHANRAEYRVLQAELLVSLGRLIVATTDQASSEAGGVFEEALALCRELDRSDTTTRASGGLFDYLMARSQLRAARQVAQDLWNHGQRYDDVDAHLEAEFMLGAVSLHEGRLEEASTHLETRLALTPYRRSAAMDMPPHSGPQALGHLAISLTVLGRLDHATQRARLAHERAMHLKPYSVAGALATLSVWAFVARDLVALSEMTAVLISLAEKKGYLGIAAVAGCQQAWLSASQGNLTDKLGIMSAGLATLAKLERVRWAPYLRLMYSDVLARAKKPTEALSALDEALEISARTSDLWLDAELHRRKGELLFAQDWSDTIQAEQELRHAIDIARGHRAKLFELRSATSLARLWSAQGRRAEAHKLLAAAHGWFTEDFNHPDLQEGNAVLVELAA
jgi:class 3 adenylate cyclase/predicted ATPase